MIRKLFRLRTAGPLPLAARSRRVNLDDADSRQRPESTYLQRPDAHSPIDPEPATRQVDRDSAVEVVLTHIRRLLAAGALDGYTSDVCDALIDHQREEWDAAAEASLPGHLRVGLRLAAQELEFIATVQLRVAHGRAELARLEQAAGTWRQVLLGQINRLPFQVAEPVPGPAPVGPRALPGLGLLNPVVARATTTLGAGKYGPATGSASPIDQPDDHSPGRSVNEPGLPQYNGRSHQPGARSKSRPDDIEWPITPGAHLDQE